MEEENQTDHSPQR